MMATSQESVNSDLGRSLSALACLCNRIVTAVRKPYKLSVFEFHTLLTIHTRHPSCVSGLTESMEMDKTRMSKVLRSLEEHGFIQRMRDPADHRIDHIHLTESGACLADSLLYGLNEAGKALFRGMPEQERAAFERFLETTGDMRTDDIPNLSHPPTIFKNEANR